MDLRQRTTVATDPFATIKGIGSLTLRAEQYADLDAPSVARSVSVERTLQTLVNLSAQAHPLETSTLKGAREGVDGEEQRHLTAPRFYLLDLALRVWSETTYAHLPDRRFVDLTGSNGENCVAASLLRDWVSCRSIEPIPEARVLAKALVDERDKRHNRRRRGASRRGREPQKPPAQVYIEEASCLWNCDWYDCDVALFDATRPAFSAFVDEGAFIRAALWPGLARCAEGTVVCLISRDPNPTVRRAELIPTEGPSACELLGLVRDCVWRRRHGRSSKGGHRQDRRAVVGPPTRTKTRAEQDDGAAAQDAGRAPRVLATQRDGVPARVALR